MADLSDVLRALRDAAAAALYPAGIPVGAAPPSAAGAPVRIYVGWPGADLDADLARGICHVSIWPRPGVARTLSPYMTGDDDRPGPPPSMGVVAEGEAVTFGGSGANPAMIAAVIVDRAAAYTLPIQPGQGPVEVAAAFAAKIVADRPASAAGPVLTVPGAFALVARVVAGGETRREVRRQEQSLLLGVWAPSPPLRDAVARLLDEALIDLRTMAMPDGSRATVRYDGTGYDEGQRQQPLHRRDLMLSIEYSNLRVTPVPGIAAPDLEYGAADDVIRRTILS